MMDVDLRPVVPALIVTITGFFVLLEGAFSGSNGEGAGRARSRNLAITGLGLALAAVVAATSNPGAILGGTVVADRYALFLEGSILLVALLAAVLAGLRLADDAIRSHEFFALFCFSVVGMLGLATTTEAISMFVALEIMSVALYAMCGMARKDARSQEAALKYFVTGAFASAFLLFGVALLYGASGSTSLGRMGAAAAEGSLLALGGAALVFVGFCFKVGAAPFHMWTPDVYQGAPTYVTAYMSAAVKIAAFGALGRIVVTAIPAASPAWAPGLALVAAATMVIGNLGALAQTDLKRLLAFSSVAHAGYVLAGYVASPNHSAGVEAVLFYVSTYAAVNLGSFGVLLLLRRDGAEPVTVRDLAGLGQRSPALAALLTIFLISLTGIPVSAGFVGKFQLFKAAVEGGFIGLAVLGVLMSVVSAFYYLRIVVTMYMEEPAEGVEIDTAIGAPASVVAFCAALAFGLGLFPAPLMELARAAAQSLLQG
jgi:NADH-quinone oxidoreductase subunit N